MKKFNVILLGMLIINLISFSSKKILVIESYGPNNLWDISYEKGLIENLGNNYELEFFYMNTKTIPKSKFKSVADRAFQKYISTKPDLVILGDDNALKYLGKRFQKVDTPFIFLGINNNPRKYFEKYPRNMTGVLERPFLKRSIVYLKEIVPNLERVLVLFDSGVTTSVVKKDVFYNKDFLSLGGIQVELKTIGNWDNWQEEIKNATKKYDAVIMGLYHTIKTINGKSILADDVLKWSSENINIPMFAFWDFAVGKDKAIGGLVLFGEDQGREAAKLVKRILEDKIPPYKILTVTAKKGQFLFSKSELKKYNLKLPDSIFQRSIIIE